MTRSPCRTVRGSSFRLLWSGHSVSVIGDGMALLVLPLIVLQMSGSALFAALAAAPQPIAYALVGLIAGSVVDRFDSRAMLVGCDIARAGLFGVLCALVWSGWAEPWSILLLALASAVAGVLFETAHTMFVKESLDTDQLVAANSRLEAVNQIGLMGGPVLAGGIAAAAGTGTCLLVNVVSYVASALCLVLIRRDPRTGRASGTALSALRTELVDGLRHLWHDRVVRRISTLQTVVNFAVATETLIVYFAVHTLHGGATGASLVVAAAAAGGLAGACLGGPLASRVSAERLIALSVLALAVAFGLAAVAPGLVWLAAANVGVGAASVFATVTIRSLRQAVVPERYLARVTGAARTVAVIAYPIGIILVGLLTDLRGGDPRPAFACASVVTLGCAVLALRARASRHEPEPLVTSR